MARLSSWQPRDYRLNTKLTCAAYRSVCDNIDLWLQNCSLLKPVYKRSDSNLLRYRAKARALWRHIRAPRRRTNIFPLLVRHIHYKPSLENNKKIQTQGPYRQVFEVVAVFKWLTHNHPLSPVPNVSATEILFMKRLTFYTALNQMLKWNDLTDYYRWLILSLCSICLFLPLL